MSQARQVVLAQLRQDVLAGLRRAGGQQGKALEITLEEVADQPGNAGTLFEIRWRVDERGHLWVRGWVDGLPFTSELILV